MTPLRIDILSDTVCPWCYVGKRHLESALKQRPDAAFDCHWQPFQLNPDLPADGAERVAYWRQKFGDEARIRGMMARLNEVGAELGIEFDFDAITRQPNTLLSHALLHELDGDWTVQNQLKELILSAFFIEGKDIGLPEVLLELAADCGMTESAAHAALTDPARLARVRKLDEQARAMGVSGVPTFIFDQRFALVGAQPTEALLGAIDQAIEQIKNQSSAPGAPADD